jgi:ferrous iron transport protein B
MMAARTMESERDRLITILVAPLMTCSARLPVYAVLIAAFIPNTMVGPVNAQGLVLFGLYLSAVFSGLIVALALKRTVAKGRSQSLVMELPSYKWPQPRDVLVGLWQRSVIFLRRAGTVIFTVSVVLWVMVSYPGETLRESFAGRIAGVLEPIFAPIGFTLEMVIALVPGLAAREVAVGALGTVYAVQNAEENEAGLAAVLQNEWSLAAALAFLAWYVFAPQCISTIAVARRETNSRRWTAFMVGYLFTLAYLAAGITYWVASAFGA